MLVRPKAPFVARINDQDVVLGPADIVDSNDPCVRARPEMFEPVRATIESATAAPGELRNTRRG